MNERGRPADDASHLHTNQQRHSLHHCATVSVSVKSCLLALTSLSKVSQRSLKSAGLSSLQQRLLTKR